jgi:hypothetical protein
MPRDVPLVDVTFFDILIDANSIHPQHVYPREVHHRLEGVEEEEVEDHHR